MTSTLGRYGRYYQEKRRAMKTGKRLKTDSGRVETQARDNAEVAIAGEFGRREGKRG